MDAVLTLICSAVFLLSVAGAPPQPAKKQLVAHRGASAYAPEHTLDAYTLAMKQGADLVEQDLAVTRDGVFVCIHDLSLERTTNVEEVFPDRFTEDKSGAAPVRRWLVNDFTLAEIKRLDAGSWFDRKFAGARIPTFQEAIDLVKGKAGMYPELKDPEFYRQRGVSPETLLAAILKKNGLIGSATTPIIIQSFDDTTLRHLAKDLPQVPRVFLVDLQAGARLGTAEQMKEIATWATGVAPHKGIVEKDPALVKRAHDAGLTVTCWTFRASTTTFPSVREEMAKFLYDYGIDALFTDNPDMFPRR